jgi:hypothetical protein
MKIWQMSAAGFDMRNKREKVTIPDKLPRCIGILQRLVEDEDDGALAKLGAAMGRMTQCTCSVQTR